MNIKELNQKIGPGLLYAAAAIGVSHLVQSTRAGAEFGYQLVWAVVIANILKYPFFRIGPKYTSITNKSLLEGYKSIGDWAIYLFFIITLGTMFAVQAAVTLVTAGLAINLLGLNISAPMVSLALLLICACILHIGKFKILDNLIKIIIIILTITTIISLFTASFGDFPKTHPEKIFSFNNNTHVFFLMALIGWMPAPMDIPIWHSLWSVSKIKETKKPIPLKDAILDFNVGFIGTAFLALCFLSLGSIVMYKTGTTFAGSAAGFASQLIGLYTQALGEWARPVISIAAFTTMFSTTLTCLDAFPRILTEATRIQAPNINERKTYFSWSFMTIFGACIILFWFAGSMKVLIDFATTLSFVVAPVFAILNYKVMKLAEIPSELRPKGFIKFLCCIGIFFFTAFSLYFIYLKL